MSGANHIVEDILKQRMRRVTQGDNGGEERLRRYMTASLIRAGHPPSRLIVPLSYGALSVNTSCDEP